MYRVFLLCVIALGTSLSISAMELEDGYYKKAEVDQTEKRLSRVEQLLGEFEIDVNNTDYNCVTPLHWIALSGDCAFAQLLLNQGANVNAKDCHSFTPLFWAYDLEDPTEMIELLTRYGADVDAKDDSGYTAAQRYQRSLWDKFSTNPFIENIPDDKHLTLEKIKVDSVDDNYNTPLHWAAMVRNPDLAARIIAHAHAMRNKTIDINAETYKSIFVNCRNRNDHTPLHWGAWCGNKEMVCYLRNHGAFPLEKYVPWQSIIKYKNDEMIRLLLWVKLDLNAQDVYGRTPLHWAAAFGCFSLVKFLIEKGALLNITDGNGVTPGELALRIYHHLEKGYSKKSHQKILEFFSQHGFAAVLD